VKLFVTISHPRSGYGLFPGSYHPLIASK
jgi:hypothetical protein